MTKKCFMNTERVCDLTCKAAFEVDDPVDNIDCHFIWLAFHLGEGFHELKHSLGGNCDSPPGFGGMFSGGGPKAPPKGGPSNN